ncbi:uncharacterized protein LOC119336357 [Triticum dicoccoides]|uniref:uncharacterized protein LOC119336357 n=1 Tax=Triticum dicoccoides TaxID=85692 RepID=UPI0018916BF1|nr:uncharacterized protein LOC119336357 [Triticum dicoccoides]
MQVTRQQGQSGRLPSLMEEHAAAAGCLSRSASVPTQPGGSFSGGSESCRRSGRRPCATQLGRRGQARSWPPGRVNGRQRLLVAHQCGAVRVRRQRLLPKGVDGVLAQGVHQSLRAMAEQEDSAVVHDLVFFFSALDSTS